MYALSAPLPGSHLRAEPGCRPAAVLYTIIFYVALAWAAYKIVQILFTPASPLMRFFRSLGGPTAPSFWPGGGGGGGGGGGPGFGGGAAPPPYSRKPDDSTGAGWRPGFWSGAALGAAGTHLLGRRGDAPRQRGWGGGMGGAGLGDGWGEGMGYGGNAYAGGGGGGGARAPVASGSGTRPSTGFGGTRNR